VRRYGKVEALKGVSMDLGPGEVLGLLGSNGAGKTTCLEIILGLRRPDSGEVAIAGIDVSSDPSAALASVGAVLQSAALQDSITPRKAVELFASFHGAHARADGLLGQFGLEGKADAAFATLSSGQRQRLFLALALVNDPAVVVLDEPTAGLDPRSRRELHDLIALLRSQGRSVLLSTHDLEEAERICDRIVILHEGRAVMEACPSQLRAAADGHSTLAFSVEPGMNEAAVRSLEGVMACEGAGGTWRASTSNLTRSLKALSGAVEAAGGRITDLKVIRPSLEDVFLEITGTSAEGGKPS
jgi:ABC-2 type transport system ATP-binding protein